ncbi:radical SAM enzyme [Periconia macrospinosa]|uniref:Radical SAM enzyme n=1 Tax=Periconia macrospinosa TaxID=97972 RepID=A0A2V1DA90_9PLEO|nr:radical SAM enzyme [Periconia macrospinosa]
MVLVDIFKAIWTYWPLLSGTIIVLYIYQDHKTQFQLHQIQTKTALDPDAPKSITYSPSRQCNFRCGFCFHPATNSTMPISEAQKGLRLLRAAGMQKLNIAGGEPFLHPRFLAQLLIYSKEHLHLDCVSILSNGSKIPEYFLERYGKYIDILAISCDSFIKETNEVIRCGDDGDKHVEQLFRVAGWCRRYGVRFKLNTVVNAYNWSEDMVAHITELELFRWEVFPCLSGEGENENETRVRDASKFLVSDEQWNTFCERHKHLECFVPQDHRNMAGSYLLLDEEMCFLDKGTGG